MSNPVEYMAPDNTEWEAEVRSLKDDYRAVASTVAGQKVFAHIFDGILDFFEPAKNDEDRVKRNIGVDLLWWLDVIETESGRTGNVSSIMETLLMKGRING